MLGAISRTLTAGIGKVMAGSSSRFSTLTLEESLQLALRAIDTDVTKVAADTLANSPASFVALDLHLRDVEIVAVDVELIANALPNSLTELGLVGCSIGDQGGDAILDWAKRAN